MGEDGLLPSEKENLKAVQAVKNRWLLFKKELRIKNFEKNSHRWWHPDGWGNILLWNHQQSWISQKAHRLKIILLAGAVFEKSGIPGMAEAEDAAGV